MQSNLASVCGKMRGSLAVLTLWAPLVVAQPTASLGGESEVVLACRFILSSEDEYDLIVMWDRAIAGEEVVQGYLLSTFGDSPYYFYREPDGNLRGVSEDDDNYQVTITSSLMLLQYDFNITNDDGTTAPDTMRTCRVMAEEEINALRADERLPPR